MWSAFFLLPNLSLRGSVGNDYIAVLPYNDQNVCDICSSSPTAKILRSFLNPRQALMSRFCLLTPLPVL